MIVLVLALAAAAQQGATPAKPASPADYNDSRLDLYGGYAYLRPNASVAGVQMQPINAGALTNVAFYFTRHIGVQGEGSICGGGPNDCVYTAMGGPIVRFPHGRFVPWAHVLGGGVESGGPQFQPDTWGYGLAAGGGVDLLTPLFKQHLAFRLIQGDFVYGHVDYGTPGLLGLTGGDAELHALRLSAGLMLRFGGFGAAAGRPGKEALACTAAAQPLEVNPGETVTVTATPTGLKPKQTPVYSWTTTGGTVNGNGREITIDTRGLAPGNYGVTAHVSAGQKKGQDVDCTAGFSIKLPAPPTLTCAATPTVVQAGDKAAVSAHGASPSNRPLTYSYQVSAGHVEGTGSEVVLDTAGAPPGNIIINCTATDDQGLSGRDATAVHVVTPVGPPAAKPPEVATKELCSLSFKRDTKRPGRVDNESKACLDGIALEMQQQPDAKLAIVGEAAPDEPGGQHLAATRAMNTRQYLVVEKEIDASRIELFTDHAQLKQVENILVPSGATLDRDGLTPVTEEKIVHPNAYGRPRAKGHRPAHHPKKKGAETPPPAGKGAGSGDRM
jgi:hypothetical protein